MIKEMIVEMIMEMIGPGVGRGVMLHKFQEQIRGEATKLILEDGGKAFGDRQHLQPRQLRQRQAGSFRRMPETKLRIRSSPRRNGGLQAIDQPTGN